jgi:hypothetical protein
MLEMMVRFCSSWALRASPDLLGVESPTEPLSIILLLEAAKVVLVLDNCEQGKVSRCLLYFLVLLAGRFPTMRRQGEEGVLCISFPSPSRSSGSQRGSASIGPSLHLHAFADYRYSSHPLDLPHPRSLPLP